jgi:Ca2+-binding RTX toxin-like protein
VVEDLQSISLSSSGANISLGSIVASNTGTFSAAISSSATVSVGELNLKNPGTSFVVTGSGTLDPITFSNEAYTIINLSDLVTDATISFANADIGVNIVSGSGNDTITLGLGADVATGNSGSNIFVVNNGSTGLTIGTADTITDFQFGTDKLKLGLAGDGTVDTGNYVENSTGVEDYAAALSTANSALNTLNSTSAATELYAFEYDSNSGYLFIDSDSDGAAEDLIILSGVESTTISAGDIIA